MSAFDHYTQLLAARESGFENKYRGRHAQLLVVTRRWIKIGVPAEIVGYEVLKRLWLEFFAEDFDSICPWVDPAPDQLLFDSPSGTAPPADEYGLDAIKEFRKTFLTQYGQLRLVPAEEDIEQNEEGTLLAGSQHGYPPPVNYGPAENESKETKVARYARQRRVELGIDNPEQFPALPVPSPTTTSSTDITMEDAPSGPPAVCLPLVAPVVLPLPAAPTPKHTPAPTGPRRNTRAASWWAPLEDAKTEEGARELAAREAEHRAAISSAVSEEEGKELMRRYTEALADAERERHKSNPSVERTIRHETFSYSEGNTVRSSKPANREKESSSS